MYNQHVIDFYKTRYWWEWIYDDVAMTFEEYVSYRRMID